MTLSRSRTQFQNRMSIEEIGTRSLIGHRRREGRDTVDLEGRFQEATWEYTAGHERLSREPLAGGNRRTN